MIAPMAMQRMAHVDGEVATARAAATANTFMCLSSLSTTNLTDLREAVPELKGIFQLYVYKVRFACCRPQQIQPPRTWSSRTHTACPIADALVLSLFFSLLQDRSVSLDLIRRAEAAGYKALCVTVDTPFIGFRESDVRNGFALPAHLTLANFTSSEDRRGKIGEKSNGSGLIAYSKSLFDRSITWKDIAWLIGQTKLPVILKGIMTEEDALMAVEVGAAGILVSNHGARQVDTCAATIEALPAIVAAVGDKLEVYVDGGIRRGVDVFKALALGARAVFVGRPFLWGLSHSGEAGVTDVHQILHAELENVMGLSGTPNLAAITRSFVTTREAMRPKL